MTPRYLLLDEPTAGLDARGRAAIRTAIGKARQSAGVVVVSHSAEEFLGEADRAVLLASGSVAFSGPASELVGDPARFADAGLIAPELLRLQQLVRDSGRDAGAVLA